MPVNRSRIRSAAGIVGFLVIASAGLGQTAGNASASPRTRPETYGTSAISYVSVPASEFVPGLSSPYESDMSGIGPRWGTEGSLGFTAGLHLPSGAQVVYVELNSIDTNPAEAVYGSLVVCDQLAGNCVNYPSDAAGPEDCQVSGFLCSGLAFVGGGQGVSADLTADEFVIDNVNHSYRLYAATFAGDGSNKIAGMVVGYVLHVSQPPATPTFNDVPTSDFGFQHIEALAASGITTGCGGGNFCPNSAVTRRQMAIFLAKALGLHFP